MSMSFPRYPLDETRLKSTSAFPFRLPLLYLQITRLSVFLYPFDYFSNEETKPCIITVITIDPINKIIPAIIHVNDTRSSRYITAWYYIVQNIFANILFKHRGTRYVPFHEFSMKRGFVRVKGSFEQSTSPPCRRSWTLIFHSPLPLLLSPSRRGTLARRNI